jgi:phosphopantetheinyl transferase
MTQAIVYWLEDTGMPPLASLLRALPSAEQAEACRYRHEQRARSFALSRLMLRHLLRKHLPDMAALTLLRETSGRLALSGTSHWHISLSHCQDRVAVMLAEAPCGVDIEIFREVNGPKIAQRYFSLAEQTWLGLLPADEVPQAFLRLWTLKEAGVKALGKGLAHHLANLAFDMTGEQPQPVKDGAYADMRTQQIIDTTHVLAAAVMTTQNVHWQIQHLSVDALPISA